MVERIEEPRPHYSKRLISAMLAPVRLSVALLTFGLLVILFEIIGLIDDALPEEEKLKDWMEM